MLWLRKQDIWLQEHAARAFWHLAVEDSDAVFDAVMESPSLAAMLRLAAPEVTKGAQLARQALRRLCEDPDVRSALDSSNHHTMAQMSAFCTE